MRTKHRYILTDTGLSFLIFFLFSLCAHAETKSRFPGPIELGNQYPLALMQPSMRPKRAGVTAPEKLKASLLTAWSNTSIREDNYTVDAETLSIETAFRYGVAQDWDIGIILPLRVQGGGSLDSFIDGWHRSFGLPRGDRTRMQDGQYDISGFDGDKFFKFGKSGFGMGSPELSANYCPAAHCYGVSLGLPSPSVDFGQQALALAPNWVMSEDYENFSYSFGAAVWFFGDRSIDGVEYRPVVPKGFAVFEYLLTKDWQVYTTLLAGLQDTRNIQGYPDSEFYLDVGTRIAIGDDISLDIMLRENPFPGHGTTDVSFVLGLSSLF